MQTREAVERLYQYGHFFTPNMPNSWNVGPAVFDLLKPDDRLLRDAVASFQDFMGAKVTGDLGPATLELLNAERCGLPDYPDPTKAVGSGGWPMPCQKGGVKLHFNKSGMPAVVVPRWDEIVRKVLAAYAEIGLRLVEVQTAGEANIYQTWQGLAGSTIGLAEFNSESCSDRVFCKLDPGYTGYVASLLAHEIGHNCNLQHRSQGGIMHPSIQRDPDPFTWTRDPSMPDLRRMYGGEPLDPIPQPPPGPGPQPNPVLATFALAGTSYEIRKAGGAVPQPGPNPFPA
jgi:hypothetical protein